MCISAVNGGVKFFFGSYIVVKGSGIKGEVLVYQFKLGLVFL